MRTVEEMFRVDGKNALVTGGAGESAWPAPKL